MLQTTALLFLLVVQTPHFRLVGQVEVEARHQGGRAILETPEGTTVIRVDVDRAGEFEFRNVRPGSYWMTVGLTGFRDIRRSVEVRPSLADSDGRISVRVELPPDARDLSQQTVTVGQLEIPSEAIREFLRARDAGGDTEKVREHLERAIEIAPNFAEALNNLGTTYHRDGDYSRSIELFQRALAADPESFQAQVNLGGSLLADVQLERALEENRRALDLRSDSSLANSQMGMTLFFLRRDQEAIPYFEKVKQLDRFSLNTPELFLSGIYLRNGDPERAADELEEFLEKLPDHPQAPSARERLRLLRPGPGY